MFWVVVEKLRWVILLTAVVAPIIGALTGMIIRERRRARGAENAEEALKTGLVYGLAALPTLFALAFCATPPGEGLRARTWFRLMQPHVDALAAYHRDVHAYPDSMEQLITVYMPDSMRRWLPSGDSARARYRVDSTGSYVLSIRYYGPGTNECDHRPDGRGWRCHGYY